MTTENKSHSEECLLVKDFCAFPTPQLILSGMIQAQNQKLYSTVFLFSAEETNQGCLASRLQPSWEFLFHAPLSKKGAVWFLPHHNLSFLKMPHEVPGNGV